MECNQIIIEELQHIPLFEALKDVQLKKILNSARKIKLPAKSILFERTTPAKYFYLLHSGQVKLFILSAEGDEKVMEIIYPSQTFAEAIMFIPKQNYPVSAEAITDSELYSFDMQVFRELLDNSKETCFRLLASMGKKLHARVTEINNLTLHNATYRLVVYLLQQLPDKTTVLSTIHLATPKSIIAAHLSIKPETFSRVLLTMSKQGLIAVQGNDISLLDVEGLRLLL
ncbi:MAG: Crp/Fnr family transcriptional regulator [Gammaproteobacteria bacterium]